MPVDMYIELLPLAWQKLGIQNRETLEMALSDPSLSTVAYSELSEKLKAIDEILNDPQRARQEFFGLPAPNSEHECVKLLEEYYRVLSTLNVPVAGYYKQELKNFVEQHNLRYVVTSHCQLLLTIPGLLASEYVQLRNKTASNANISEALALLEKSISQLSDIEDAERTLIERATRVIEAIARLRTTNSGKTLGFAVKGCNVFPHEKLRDCITDYWDFTSDYPNLRHSGTATSKLRELKKDDALLALAIAIAFGMYIFDNDSADSIVKGNL